MRKLSIAILVATAVVGLVGCSVQQGPTDPATDGLCGPARDGEMVEFPVMNGGGTTSKPYIMLGIKEGCFAAQGLEVVNLSSAGSNANKLASLLGGQAWVAAETPTELVAAMANQDTPIQAIAGIYEILPSSLESARDHQLEEGRTKLSTVLIAGPNQDISDFGDLAGLRVGATPGISSSVLGLTRTLVNSGENPEDVEIVPLATADRLVALERGDIDAGLFTGASAYSAMDAGGTMVGYPKLPISVPGVVMLWYTTDELAEKHRSEIAGFKEAVRQINELLSDPRNEPDFVDLLSTEFGLERSVAERFGVPDLVTRDLTASEIADWSGLLLEQGLIEEPVSENRIVFFGE